MLVANELQDDHDVVIDYEGGDDIVYKLEHKPNKTRKDEEKTSSWFSRGPGNKEPMKSKHVMDCE